LAAGIVADSQVVMAAQNPTAENPRRIILDIDPGIDDAMAVLLATQSPELQIEAITVVSGNVIVDLGAENALKLVELAERPDIIVAKGAKYPLQRKLITAEAVHGTNGLGNVELPTPSKKLDPRHAVQVIVDIVNANPGEITLVPVGPLTNIALALLQDPTLREKVPEIILMGGSVIGGNASPAAEANIYNDPEAAKVVFNSGIPITMVGLGATSQAKLYRRHLPTLADSGSPIGKFIADICDFYIGFSERIGFEGSDLHDPLAVGMAFDKTFAKKLWPMHIDVETKGELTYGETVANRYLLLESFEDVGDHYEITSFPKVEPNAEVPTIVDGDRFVATFVERLSAMPRKP
jgi:inosine-uridine nucleoside N-ribohydrolase